MACDRCAALTHPSEITKVDDLTSAVRTVRAKVSDGTLVELPAASAESGGSLAKLPEGGPWPDEVELRLRCADCGTRFRLSARSGGDIQGSWGPEGEARDGDEAR